MPNLLRTVIVMSLLALGARAAAAQPTWQPSETQAKCIAALAAMNESAGAPMVEGEERRELGPVSRIASLGDVCLGQVRDDANFAAFLDKKLVYAVHRDEAEEFTEDQRHVVMAYIAIWVLTAGFVGFLFVRQGKLRGEIDRLQAEVDRAAREAEK